MTNQTLDRIMFWALAPVTFAAAVYLVGMFAGAFPALS